MDPVELRRRNVVRPATRCSRTPRGPDDPSDLVLGSYGLDQCLDLVDGALRDRTAADTHPDRSGGWAPASPPP